MIYLPSIDSTNAELKRQAAQGAEEGTVVWAEQQQAGRGRLERTWSSSEKGIACSVLLTPPELQLAPRYSFVTAVAVAEGIAKVTGLTPGLKWPNDIYVGKEKLCGVLISTKFRGATFNSAVIGIGFNVNQTLFSRDIPNPTSLKIITGRDYDLDAVLNGLLIKIDMWYEVLKIGNFDRLDSVYIENFLYLGQERDYYYKEKPLRATIIGVEKNGFLRIKSLDNEEINCDLKELRFIH